MSLENTQGIGGVATAIWLASNGLQFNTIRQQWYDPKGWRYFDVNEACDFVTGIERHKEATREITCDKCPPKVKDKPHGILICDCGCHFEQLEKWK